LVWGPTTLRFRSVLKPGRFTHVVVTWSDDTIGLYLDGTLVEADSVGAPTDVDQPHRVGVAAAGGPGVVLREAAIYSHDLQIRRVQQHHRVGLGVFGPFVRSVAEPARPMAYAAAVPGNTALPTISGTAKDGQTLTSTTGTWTGSPTSYARAWQRCDTAGANCTAISGATGTTYLVTSADVGMTIRVKVTATNASGSSSATSAATGVVSAAAPVNSAAPAITGTAKDGQTLTSSTGTWTGTTPLTYARQWRRCDSAGANCADIAGATGTTYALTGLDVGSTVRVVVTASNTAGSAPATSAATAVVTTAPPANTAAPTISGTAKEGQLLSASTGTWTGSAAITYTYQWQSCTSAGASCAAISGATLSTYRLAAADVGRTVKVSVTATNGVGTASATSTASAVATTGPPVNTVAPTAAGTARDGQTLTTTNGSWAGTATISYTRQWKRCDVNGASCVSISGATGTSYTLVSADVGSTIRATWTATNAVGSSSADTSPTAVVAGQPPVNTAVPTITGTAKDGQTLTVSNGTWTGSATITYTRAWKRCDTAGANCSTISGATGTTYVLSAADVGSTIRATVTASNSAGSASADTAATAIVTAQAPVNTAVPTITGTAKDGQVLTATNGTWTGSATITYTREWRRCDSAGNNCVAIAGENATTYTATSSDVGKRLRVAVTATNSVGTATAVSAATGTVAAIAPFNTSIPTISGTAGEGVRLFAGVGTWTGSQPLTYTYQWQRCDAAGANCAPEWPAETDTWYRPWSPDLGSTIRVAVTARNAAGSTTATSNATAVIAHSAPVADYQGYMTTSWSDPTDVPPGLTDDTAFIWGMDMGIGGTSWSGSQPITESKQWLRCDEHGDSCTDITGQTGWVYDTGLADYNHTLRARITATNDYGSTSYLTAASVLVSNGNPTNVSPPSIVGSARSHQKLTTTPAGWQGPLPQNVVEHFWERCDADGTNCVRISDDSSEEHELTDADVGHRLRLEEQVSYNDDGLAYWYGRGQGTKTSALTNVIADASTPPAVTLGGDLVAAPNQWLDGDSYTLSVNATAGSDASGLASVAVMYDGQNVAEFDGCDGPSCAVSHDVDIDTGETVDGRSPLWVIVTDRDGTATTEKRDIRIDRGAPRPPQHPLVDMAGDGTATLTWQPSGSPDVASYEVLRRSSSDDPFTVVGTTEDTTYVDTSGTGTPLAPMARMNFAATVAQADPVPDTGQVEYHIRAVDQAGSTGEASSSVSASPDSTGAPAPAQVQVAQASSNDPVAITWDPSPGASRYVIERSFDADAETAGSNPQGRSALAIIADVPAAVTDISDTVDAPGRYTYSVRPVSDTGQLGEWSPATTTTLQPQRVPMSQELLDHIRDIGGAVDDGGAPAREPFECPLKCKLFREAERKLPRVGAKADKIAELWLKLRVRTGAFPTLAVLSDANIYADTFLAGWTVGTYLRKAYFTEDTIDPSTLVPEIHRRKFVFSGDVAETWACGPDFYWDACIGNGGTAIIGHMLAPMMGATGRNAGSDQIMYETWDDECKNNSHGELIPEDPQKTLPGGWFWLKDTGPCPVWWGGHASHWVPFHRVRFSTPVSGPEVPASSGTVIPVRNDISQADAEQKLLNELQGDPSYGPLIRWLEAEMGGTGTSSDGTPNCTNMTYEACVSAFQHAGFEGPFNKKVLDPDEAWIGVPAGAVVDTSPWADEQLDEDGPVEVEVNPAVMPDWTPDDQEIADRITTNNTTANQYLEDPTLVKNSARRCRLRVQAAGLPTSDCWSLPIMITGGLDAMGAANNDADALKRHSRWVGVNRRDEARPPGDRWYIGVPGPGGGCVQQDGRNPVGMECDEYPMWKMSQGHNGPLETEPQNITWVPRDENRQQGKVLKKMYNEFDPGALPFPGCNVPATPDPGLAPGPSRDVVPPTFLAVPAPVRLMPSMAICNSGI
jgi:hypothetical protein